MRVTAERSDSSSGVGLSIHFYSGYYQLLLHRQSRDLTALCRFRSCQNGPPADGVNEFGHCLRTGH